MRQALYQGRNLSPTTTLGEVDIVQVLPGVASYADLASRASREVAFGVHILICSRDDLVAMKRARGSPLDMADLAHLGAP